MKVEALKEMYSGLEKKYGLPSYDEMNDAFEIVALDYPKDGIFINALIRLMISKLANNFMNFLSSVIMPQSQSTYSMIIHKNLDSSVKEKAYSLYKEISKLTIHSFKVLLMDEKTKAEFVKDIFKKYGPFEKTFLEIVGEVEGSIDKNSKKSFAGYMG